MARLPSAGGDAEPFERAEPVISLYARAVNLIGPAGSGQLTKMVNQLCIAGLIQIWRRAFISLRPGSTWARDRDNFEGSGAILADGQPLDEPWRRQVQLRICIDWMRKDFAIILDELAATEAFACGGAVDQFYSEIQAMGGNRWDTSSLIARLSRK